uniref:Uncharacterized protein n=1 Tax=Mus musculus TaxID=10090 RepID=Q8C5S4_MOUSE|nr:unnamed protein product [Mus musculus]
MECKQAICPSEVRQLQGCTILSPKTRGKSDKGSHNAPEIKEIFYREEELEYLDEGSLEESQSCSHNAPEIKEIFYREEELEYLDEGSSEESQSYGINVPESRETISSSLVLWISPYSLKLYHRGSSLKSDFSWSNKNYVPTIQMGWKVHCWKDSFHLYVCHMQHHMITSTMRQRYFLPDIDNIEDTDTENAQKGVDSQSESTHLEYWDLRNKSSTVSPVVNILLVPEQKTEDK